MLRRQVTHLCRCAWELSQSFWGFHWIPRILRHPYPSSLFRSPISPIHAGSWMVPPRQVAQLGPRCLGYFHTRKAREPSKTSSLNQVYSGFSFKLVPLFLAFVYLQLDSFWVGFQCFSNLVPLTVKFETTPNPMLCVSAADSWSLRGLEATNHNHCAFGKVQKKHLWWNTYLYTLAMLGWIAQNLSFQGFMCLKKSSRNIREALKQRSDSSWHPWTSRLLVPSGTIQWIGILWNQGLLLSGDWFFGICQGSRDWGSRPSSLVLPGV